jgi:hypothetical protein
MLRIFLLFLLSFSAFAGPRGLPIWLQDNNNWQQAQIIHIQTQQQLQAQDQYRRQLLIQDDLRQIQRITDRQSDLERLQRNQLMHNHSDRLLMYSRSIKPLPEAYRKKLSK